MKNSINAMAKAVSAVAEEIETIESADFGLAIGVLKSITVAMEQIAKVREQDEPKEEPKKEEPKQEPEQKEEPKQEESKKEPEQKEEPKEEPKKEENLDVVDTMIRDDARQRLFGDVENKEYFLMYYKLGNKIPHTRRDTRKKRMAVLPMTIFSDEGWEHKRVTQKHHKWTKMIDIEGVAHALSIHCKREDSKEPWEYTMTFCGYEVDGYNNLYHNSIKTFAMTTDNWTNRSNPVFRDGYPFDKYHFAKHKQIKDFGIICGIEKYWESKRA